MLSRLVIAFLPRSKSLLISWLQSSYAVMLEPKKIKSVTDTIVSPSIYHDMMGLDAMILVFEFWVLSQLFSLSSFTFIKRLFNSSSLSAIRVVSSAYLNYWYFSQQFLIPACASCSPAICMMQSSYKLNKQGDNIQPWCTPFTIWNQSVVPGLVLTVAPWPAYRFLRSQGRWSGIPISLRIFQKKKKKDNFLQFLAIHSQRLTIQIFRVTVCILTVTFWVAHDRLSVFTPVLVRKY